MAEYRRDSTGNESYPFNLKYLRSYPNGKGALGDFERNRQRTPKCPSRT
jgi:hypothetical protein